MHAQYRSKAGLSKTDDKSEWGTAAMSYVEKPQRSGTNYEETDKSKQPKSQVPQM